MSKQMYQQFEGFNKNKDYEEITIGFKQIMFLVVFLFIVVPILYWLANSVLPFWWIKIGL
jgi:hypothetical protein